LPAGNAFTPPHPASTGTGAGGPNAIGLGPRVVHHPLVKKYCGGRGAPSPLAEAQANYCDGTLLREPSAKLECQGFSLRFLVSPAVAKNAPGVFASRVCFVAPGDVVQMALHLGLLGPLGQTPVTGDGAQTVTL
jgi:hypothetical protein